MTISKEKSFKSDRQKCYQSRDVYFNCLDSSEECAEKCVQPYNDFFRDCPKSWVLHFVRQREFNKYKKEFFEVEAAQEDSSVGMPKARARN